MVIFPLAPDQTIAEMWSNGARGGGEGRGRERRLRDLAFRKNIWRRRWARRYIMWLKKDIWILHAQVTKLSVGLISSTLHFQLTVVLLIVGNVQAYYSVISTLISTKLVHTCKLQYHSVDIFFNSALEINNSLTQNCHNYSNNTCTGANIMNSYRLSMGSHSNAYCCVAWAQDSAQTDPDEIQCVYVILVTTTISEHVEKDFQINWKCY